MTPWERLGFFVLGLCLGVFCWLYIATQEPRWGLGIGWTIYWLSKAMKRRPRHRIVV